MDKTAFRKQLYSDKSEEAWLHSTWRDTSHQNNNIYTFFCFWLLNKGHRKCSLVDKSVDFFLFFSCSNPQPRSSSNLTVNTCSRKCLNELTWNAMEQNPTEAPEALRLKKKKKKEASHPVYSRSQSWKRSGSWIIRETCAVFGEHLHPQLHVDERHTDSHPVNTQFFFLLHRLDWFPFFVLQGTKIAEGCKLYCIINSIRPFSVTATSELLQRISSETTKNSASSSNTGCFSST